MTRRFRNLFIGLQITLAGASMYLAWQTHETSEKIRAFKPFGGCKQFHNGMTISPGECAYIILPGPPADATTGEKL